MKFSGENEIVDHSQGDISIPQDPGFMSKCRFGVSLLTASGCGLAGEGIEHFLDYLIWFLVYPSLGTTGTTPAERDTFHRLYPQVQAKSCPRVDNRTGRMNM